MLPDAFEERFSTAKIDCHPVTLFQITTTSTRLSLVLEEMHDGQFSRLGIFRMLIELSPVSSELVHRKEKLDRFQEDLDWLNTGEQ